MRQSFRLAIAAWAFEPALAIAKNLGVEVWRAWPPGDAHDIAFLVTLVVYLVLPGAPEPDR